MVELVLAGLGVQEISGFGEPKAYTLPSFEPIQIMPQAKAGEESVSRPVRKFQIRTPVAAFKAYTFPSLEPM